VVTTTIALMGSDGTRDVVEPTERAARSAQQGVDVARAAAADQAATNKTARELAERELEALREAADREQRGQISLVTFTVTVVLGPGGGLAGARLVVVVRNRSTHEITSLMLLLHHGPAMREVMSSAGTVEVSTTEPIPACTEVRFEVPLDTRLTNLGFEYAWHILMPEDPMLMIMQGPMVWVMRSGGWPAIAENSPDFPRTRTAEAKHIGKITYSAPPTTICP
jgi:hypothetical protein